MNGSTAERVESVIRRCLHADRMPLRRSTRLAEDLGADSLSLVDLTLALEDEFEVVLEGNDLVRLETVGDAIEYVTWCLSLAPPGDSPTNGAPRSAAL